MPVFKYRCLNCEKEFEERVRISESENKYCSKCGGETKKVFDNINVKFKGDGFYINNESNEESE